MVVRADYFRPASVRVPIVDTTAAAVRGGRLQKLAAGFRQADDAMA